MQKCLYFVQYSENAVLSTIFYLHRFVLHILVPVIPFEWPEIYVMA
jgi:hypothetical protein